MKTSELKHLAKSKGFRVNDDDEGNLAIVTDSTNVTELLTVWKRFAVISNMHAGVFSIYDSNQLDDELFDAIIIYARTPIAEREERYLNVDIPLSDWEEIAKGFNCESKKIDNTVTANFKGNYGIDSFFKVIETIQGKYVEQVEAKGNCDETEREDTSH